MIVCTSRDTTSDDLEGVYVGGKDTPTLPSSAWYNCPCLVLHFYEMVSEWLGYGLQNHIREFDSLPSLQFRITREAKKTPFRVSECILTVNV